MGLPQLQAYAVRHGLTLPTGLGVPVHHVEAQSPAGSGQYRPNSGLAQFAGKTFQFKSGTAADPSAHANEVGNIFYGNTRSWAPSVGVAVTGQPQVDIEVYEVNDWLEPMVLRPGGTANPALTDSRLANHSWVDNGQGAAATLVDRLERVDWLVMKDDFIQVVGANNGNEVRDWLAGSFNAIAVGLTNGNHARGTNPLDSVYVAGRVKPDLVAIGYRSSDQTYATSWATPMVSAAAAMLIESSQSAGSAISNGSYITPRTRATGPMTDDIRVYHADASETIKALLMAGADRWTHNLIDRPEKPSPTTPDIVDIRDYRSLPTHQTVNGLDARFGAGQLNIFNSYLIQQAGERDSSEDGGAGSADALRGWDYDPAFGGGFDLQTLRNSNTTGSYTFTASPGANRLTATLAWNVRISDGVGNLFGGTPTLHDIDLWLYDVTDPTQEMVVTASVGTIDNTETIWTPLTNGHTYRLAVQRKPGQSSFLHDYALAWRLVGDYGDFDSDGDIDADDIDALTAALGSGSIRYDLNGDGRVDGDDYAEMVGQIVGTAVGDVNLDGRVGIGDLSLLAAGFGAAGGWGQGDVTGDGMVTISDLATLAARFGADTTITPPVGGGAWDEWPVDVDEVSGLAGGAVPEPGTIGLLAMGLFSVFVRRCSKGADRCG